MKLLTTNAHQSNMPRYKLIEERLVTVEYEIEAENEDDAKKLQGTILDEIETDNIPYDLVRCDLI
jgi:hypothetical protein